MIFFACKEKSKSVEMQDEVENVYVRDESWFNDFRVITFGKFEQDGNEKNGEEDIRWITLEDTGNERTLISLDVIYAMPFDNKFEFKNDAFDCDWQNSAIRKWLNEDFYDLAFSEEEKKYIMVNHVKNGNVFGINNSDEPSSMGADTFDKVYILSKDEMRKYFGLESDGYNENYIAKASEYTKKMLRDEQNKESIAIWHKEIEYEDKYNDCAEYWLRSSVGCTLMSAKELFTNIVDKRGHISNYGFPYFVSVESTDKSEAKARFYLRGVRPVIKIVGTSILEVEEKEGVRAEKKPTVYDIKRINESYIMVNYDKNKTYKDFDSVVLGSYEQDGDVSNGKEGIEWLVLDKRDNKALLLSKYILDYVEYSNILERYTVWKDSRIRAWSNHEFLENSFNEQEKVLITSARIKNSDNPVYGSPSGPSTVDKVFIPSCDELMETFNISYDDCIREPYYDQKKIEDKRLTTIYTDYALKKYRSEKNNYKAVPQAIFWLRNQGRNGEETNSQSNNAMTAINTIDFKGNPYDLFQYSNNIDKAVSSNPKLGFRPCIFVDLNILNEFDGRGYDSRVDRIFTEDIPEQNKYTFEQIGEARAVGSYNNKATFANYDTVLFGTYEQDGDASNGKENIEWIVLDKIDNQYLLLSKYVIDYCQFKKDRVEGISISWNDSDIKTWSNYDFINSAFTDEEQKHILLNPDLLPSEKVFLLSIDEILKYFGNENENYDGVKIENRIKENYKSRTYATRYARKNGVIIGPRSIVDNNVSLYSCGYFTRSMTNSNYNQVSYIRDDGSDGYLSAYDRWKRPGFRPAMWVKSESK